MRIKMPYLKLRYGNKGFVLTLDAVIAVMIIFGVIDGLISSINNKETSYNLYISKKGSDMAALLDNSNKLDTLNITQISNDVANFSILENFEMNITTYNTDLSGKSTISFNLGGTPKNFVSYGKRFFVIRNNTQITKFGVLRYRVWQK